LAETHKVALEQMRRRKQAARAENVSSVICFNSETGSRKNTPRRTENADEASVWRFNQMRPQTIAILEVATL